MLRDDQLMLMMVEVLINEVWLQLSNELPCPNHFSMVTDSQSPDQLHRASGLELPDLFKS